MENVEIKKALYQQKPMAYLRYIREGKAYYYAHYQIIEAERIFPTSKKVEFVVPVSDMGTADFNPIMEAQLLNRWIMED